MLQLKDYDAVWGDWCLEAFYVGYQDLQNFNKLQEMMDKYDDRPYDPVYWEGI